MSNDNNNNRQSNERRGSVTSAAFSNLFQRSNSTSANNAANGSGRRSSVSAVAAQDQRRRLSINTLGLSGASPPSATTPFGLRRGSISTNNSDSIDECAVDDDEPPKVVPTSPFVRRTSFGAQAMRNIRAGQASPGSGTPPQAMRRTSAAFAHPPPSSGVPSISMISRRMSTSQASNTSPARAPSDMLPARSDNGYNWAEQLRYRAESTVTGQRPSVSSVAPPAPPPRGSQHDRARSVSDMPAPPRQPEVMKPKQPERPKPDHMQERILKGDFYMD